MGEGERNRVFRSGFSRSIRIALVVFLDPAAKIGEKIYFTKKYLKLADVAPSGGERQKRRALRPYSKNGNFALQKRE